MPRPPRLTIPALVLGAAMLVPAGAPARKRDPDLWVTINRCDGARSSNRMGVRASLPGNGTKQRMYVRFRAQYFDEAGERWRTVGGSGGTSKWLLLGNAKVRARQEGYTFRIDPPAAGDQFVLRGIADFQYRARRKRRHRKPRWVVVKRIRGHSRRGIKHVPGGDPRGRSDSVCVIR
jgi:hypothetical protein